MKKTLSAVSAGALALLALTGCSSDSTAAYCDASVNLESKVDAFDNIDLGDDIFEAALTGDLEPLHAWGEEVNKLVDDVEGDMTAARDNAPSEDVADAIDTFIELIGIMDQMGDAAVDAQDFESFTVSMLSLSTEAQAAAADIDAASDLIDSTNADVCS